MSIHAEQSACCFNGSYGHYKNIQLQKERKKLEAMTQQHLEQGKSLSDANILRQNALVDKLVVELMIQKEHNRKVV